MPSRGTCPGAWNKLKLLLPQLRPPPLSQPWLLLLEPQRPLHVPCAGPPCLRAFAQEVPSAWNSLPLDLCGAGLLLFFYKLLLFSSKHCHCRKLPSLGVPLLFFLPSSPQATMACAWHWPHERPSMEDR